MDINIARFAPLTEQVKRIADALELMANLYQQDCARTGVFPRPAKAVNEPIQPEDVEYVDEEKMWLEELKHQYGILSKEEKAEMQKAIHGDDVQP